MSPAKRLRNPRAWDWQQLASLGEQVRSGDSLPSQRVRIISIVSRLIDGETDVWLDEDLFRLPDWDSRHGQPKPPPLAGMKLAVKKGGLVASKKAARNGRSRAVYAAVPLEDHGITLGVLQITRPKGPAFSREELDLLLGISQIISIGLVASHRVEVERFRLRQLNLVREVSAQIASVLDLDELAARVTELIQKTFNFYYVAIFTLEPNSNALRFRSSAAAPRKGRGKASIALEVEIGQGLIGEAVKCGAEIVAGNVQQDPRYRFIDSLPETRSEAVIPLKIEDRMLGVLDVQSDQLNAFHPNDLLILHALADNVARAVESARLYSDLRRRANQFALVSEVSKSVTSTLNLSEFMREAASLIHEQFGYPYVALYTVHPTRRLIMYEAGSGMRSQKLVGHTIPLDAPKGIIPWAARTGESVLANDVSKDERFVPSPHPPRNTRSELCIPLIFNERVVGVLDIQSDKVNAFTRADKRMFEAVAGTMAAAIRNADLYRSEQWRRQISDSLREVAGLISKNAGVDEVLDAILSELDRNLPVDISAIWLLEGDELCLAAARGIDANRLEQTCIANPEATFSMAEALMSDLPVIRKPEDPVWPGGLTAGYDRNYSSIVAPLRVGDRPLGLLTLAHHTSGRYGHEAQTITATFASYAAVAIENARLYDAAQEQAYASAALLQVAQAVVSLNDLDEILGAIIRIMPILVGVKRAALYRWDTERGTFALSHEYGFNETEDEVLTRREFPPGAFPILDAVRERNVLLTFPLKPNARPKSWLKIPPEAGGEAGTMNADQLLIGVPLSIKNDLFGVLLIEEMERGVRFRSRRIEIINGIAQQAALAIQNDMLQQEMVARERLETEVQLARQIQQTFIPDTLPAPPDWELAARWKTARQVGGDFYDVIELPNHRFGIFIADVADKGMPAALFMALTRTLMRAAVIETNSPAEAIRRVNDLLLPDTRQGMFVTAVYGELDVERCTFTYVNAGHNPPFWVKTDGSVERLTRTAVALGVVGNLEIRQREIPLSPGETLFLYTDGLTEAFSPGGDLFGEARVIEALSNARHLPIGDLLLFVENSLNEFAGATPLGDDLTMLAIKKAAQ